MIWIKKNKMKTLTLLKFITAIAILLPVSAFAACIPFIDENCAQNSSSQKVKKSQVVYVAKHHDQSETFAGTTLFADNSSSPATIVEVDMFGKIIWKYEVPKALYRGSNRPNNGVMDVEILENGNILFNIQKVGAYEITRNGKLLWKHIDSEMSHDVDRLENGNTLYVRGWVSRGKKHLVEIDTQGNEVWSWDAMNAFDKKPFSRVNNQGWIHVNAVTRKNNGNTLVSLRNFNRLVEIDRKGNVVWEKVFGRKGGKPKLGKGPHPHDPELLSSGNILVPLTGVNKVLELGSYGGKVWDWNEPVGKKPIMHIRDANRLLNGNTLIVEANRLLELDRSGNVVWELTVPSIGTSKSNHPEFLYKAIRIAE